MGGATVLLDIFHLPKHKVTHESACKKGLEGFGRRLGFGEGVVVDGLAGKLAAYF